MNTRSRLGPAYHACGFGLTALSVLGLMLGLASALCGAAFLSLLAWSSFVAISGAGWPDASLSHYQAYLGHPVTEPYASTWIGWYLLGGAAVFRLGLAACASRIVDIRGTE